MKRTSCPVFFVVFFLAYAECALAQGTYTAATCNRSDVNAVINGSTHVAVNGDVIQIPAGSCTWTSAVTVPANVGITITGTGTPDGGASTTGPSASCTATSITDNDTADRFLFTMTPGVSSSTSRISCLKLSSSNAANIGTPIGISGTCNSSTCPNFRVDNVTFDTSLTGIRANSTSIIVEDNVFGVVDHNSAGTTDPNTGMEFVAINNSAWQGVGAFGDNSWASTDSYGTNQQIYIENNPFGNGILATESEAQAPSGGEGGGRATVRFNTCNGCIVIYSVHGTDSNGRPRGGRQGEVYGNTMTCTNTGGGCQGTGSRSSTVIQFGNSFAAGPSSHYNEYMNLAVFRANGLFAPPWNNCNGTGPYDNNVPSPPICIDQPGHMGGTLLSGVTSAPTGWVNEIIHPNYEWDDSGTAPNVATVDTDYAGVIANRDWYTDNSLGSPAVQTSPTTPFNGTSGVGFGTLANRPTTCTTGTGGAPGVAYWATDQGSWNTSSKTYAGGYTQGQLYACSATNTWTLYYTPYTYPHPLVTGTLTGSTPPSPPTSLQAVVQ